LLAELAEACRTFHNRATIRASFSGQK